MKLILYILIVLVSFAVCLMAQQQPLIKNGADTLSQNKEGRDALINANRQMELLRIIYAKEAWKDADEENRIANAKRDSLLEDNRRKKEQSWWVRHPVITVSAIVVFLAYGYVLMSGAVAP